MDKWELNETKGDISKAVYKNNVVTFTFPCPNSYDCTCFKSKLRHGLYKFEVWGASGGRGYIRGKQSDFSRGGYSIGVYQMEEPSEVFVFLGGKGLDATNPAASLTPGGFNGGGYAGTANQLDGAGSGGGATDIRIGFGDKDNRVIVAGGAGGVGFRTAGYADTANDYAYGGGLIAGPGYNLNGNIQIADQINGDEDGIGQSSPARDNSRASAGGGGGYRGGLTQNYPPGATAGGGSGYIGGVISLSNIIAKSISGNEMMPALDGSQQKGNSGNGLARITLLGYTLYRRNQINMFYELENPISFDFTMNTCNLGETIQIWRSFNGEFDLIKIHVDEGEEYNFTDTFYAPKISGRYELVYSVRSTVESQTKINILVTNQPIVVARTKPKLRYTADENVIIEVEMKDDTYAFLKLKDNNAEMISIKIDSSNAAKRVNISYKIPNTYVIGSHHLLLVYATDEFGINSNILSYSITIVENQAPNIELISNSSYLVSQSQRVFMKFRLKDIDDNRMCLYSVFDDTSRETFKCCNISESIWTEFTIDRSVERLSFDVHKLTVYAIDDHRGESNRITYMFAVVQEKLLKPKSCAIKQARRSFINALYLEIVPVIKDP